MTLFDLVTEIQREVLGAQIIVVDNNSSDSTYEVASAISGVSLLSEARLGKSYAIKGALRQLNDRIKYIAIIDGDGTYTPYDLGRVVRSIVSDEKVHLVVGSRLHSTKGFSPLNFIFNKLVVLLVNLKSKQRVDDLLSGLRVWRRLEYDAVHIESHGFEFETEMTISHLKNDLTVKCMRIDYHDRKFGRSKLRRLKDGLLIFKMIMRNIRSL